MTGVYYKDSIAINYGIVILNLILVSLLPVFPHFGDPMLGHYHVQRCGSIANNVTF